jgi:hypothetical protein
MVKMSLRQAENLLGNRATWELQGIAKARSMFGMLSSDEDRAWAEAARTILRHRSRWMN